ncbi:FAD-binding oxidoreductase [Pantoea sp. ACRSH]|uniref:NAD(P)/FAD-dependent oxidoreductase n=1 Tax=unclassified Pantoea TaxID=2630326 RepID=UPI001EF52121|nr:MULTISPECIES: FAD-binding oxidoreductase [unclassified Pantoea]MCG7365889.1 FAD-binding oxidoreductase [Pantoea sp. ACRSH]MCG7396517.1 FAD-binding oxidoreductase [Pantoea sp. ACRSC]
MALEHLRRVVVLGGGALGVSSALHLAKRGAAVTLVTEAELCSGASGRSLSWLNSAGERSAPYHALRMAGIDRYRTLFAADPTRDWLRFDGGLFWEADNLSGTRARHAYEKALGYDSKLVTRDSLAQADAQVESAALGQEAIFNPGEGWVSLPHLVAHLAQQLRALGGEIVEHAGKCEVLRDGKRASGVRLASGDSLRADAVLVACGPATPGVVAPLGVTIPNGSPVSMLVITAPGAHGLKAVLNTPRAAVRPNPGNTFALDHDWYEEDIRLQADGSYAIDEQVVDQLTAEASKLIKGEPLRAASWKLGLKPIPGDGEPVLGELESVPGCFVAFTHSGATLALIAGELLAEEIVTGEKQPMLASFRPERFA